MKLIDIKLQKLRKKSGLTQQKLADLSGIGRDYIAKIETKNIENISLLTLTKYLDALGYEVSLNPLQNDKSAWKKLL